ncbi:hypothetical protein NDU88_002647 [Pleurodeles waltl]|uniref:Alkylated DNA repair protein AlkB homologue 8 N-terminal domain-containing protein n=1 Tax=Pleurodeles waltl TaxID=8319 RepID=A0AAV7UC53_PLEWA|nr:hypothetical protein NDU88_002647 [Pleurodeles waltl]
MRQGTKPNPWLLHHAAGDQTGCGPPNGPRRARRPKKQIADPTAAQEMRHRWGPHCHTANCFTISSIAILGSIITDSRWEGAAGLSLRPARQPQTKSGRIQVRLLQRFAEYCCKKSLTINGSETECMALRSSPSFKRKPGVEVVPLEVVKEFDYLGIRFSDNLSWGRNLQKVTLVLKKLELEVLVSSCKQRALAVALYVAEPCPYMNMRTLQVVENNFLRVLLGPVAPLVALYAELNFSPLSETAALRPALYWG